MSTSPSKEAELDPEAQSGEEQEHMDKDHHDAQGHQGEFEVKEQDRWLPIANGKLHLAFCSFVPIRTLLALVFSPHLPFVASLIKVPFVLNLSLAFMISFPDTTPFRRISRVSVSCDPRGLPLSPIMQMSI